MADEKVVPNKLERIYTVPFGKAYDYIRTKRAMRVVKMLRAFLSRHFKVDEKAVRISAGVNDAIWRDGMQKPPRKMKIRGVLEDGHLMAWLIGEEEANKKSLDAKKKAAEEKAKKRSEGKKDAAKPAAPATAATSATAKPAATGTATASSASDSAHAAKPTEAAKASPVNKASDVKPMPKTGPGMTTGRKQI